MNVSAVQEERGPRKEKHSIQRKKQPRSKTKKSNIKEDISLEFQFMNHQSNHYDILVQILLTCVKEARKNHHFQKFSKIQQDIILRNVWSECFVLRASHWSINIFKVFERYKILNLLRSLI
jgi:nuclear receptor